MQYVAIKHENVEALPFIKHSVVKDGQVKSIEMTLAGKTYLITAGWDHILLSQEKPDEIEKRFVVSGSVFGAKIESVTFPTEYEARQFVQKFDSHELVTEETSWNVTRSCPAGDSKITAAPIAPIEDLPF